MASYNNISSTKNKMILLNAVYFKGFWSRQFKKSMTIKKPFYNLNDKSKEKKVDRMQMTDEIIIL